MVSTHKVAGSSPVFGLFILEVMAVRVEWHLSEEKKEQLEKMRSPEKKKQKKKQEKVNWEDIMGTKNRGLKRKKGGAWTN